MVAARQARGERARLARARARRAQIRREWRQWPVSVNLDIKNPNAAEALEHLPPEQLIEDILAKEREIIAILEEMKGELADWGAG